MKSALYFYDQMTPWEKNEFYHEFVKQNPETNFKTWIYKDVGYKNFQQFIESAFDFSKFINGTDRTKYTFWFDIMIKYNVEKPSNLVT